MRFKYSLLECNIRLKLHPKLIKLCARNLKNTVSESKHYELLNYLERTIIITIPVKSISLHVCEFIYELLNSVDGSSGVYGSKMLLPLNGFNLDFSLYCINESIVLSLDHFIVDHQ